MAAAIGGTTTGTTATSASSISVSHTASGTDRAVTVAVGASRDGAGTVDSATYNSTAMTAAFADIKTTAPEAYHRQRMFYLAGDGNVPSSAVTAAATLSVAHDEVTISVMSAQGVDSATPIGTPVTTITNSATPSVTVGSVSADDLVVDHIYCGDGLTTASGPGANQTLGVEGLHGSNYYGSSYQDGADGGVMSWSLDATPVYGTTLAAFAFKPAAAAATASRLNRLLLMGVS